MLPIQSNTGVDFQRLLNKLLYSESHFSECEASSSSSSSERSWYQTAQWLWLSILISPSVYLCMDAWTRVFFYSMLIVSVLMPKVSKYSPYFHWLVQTYVLLAAYARVASSRFPGPVSASSLGSLWYETESVRPNTHCIASCSAVPLLQPPNTATVYHGSAGPLSAVFVSFSFTPSAWGCLSVAVAPLDLVLHHLPLLFSSAECQEYQSTGGWGCWSFAVAVYTPPSSAVCAPHTLPSSYLTFQYSAFSAYIFAFMVFVVTCPLIFCWVLNLFVVWKICQKDRIF